MNIGIGMEIGRKAVTSKAVVATYTTRIVANFLAAEVQGDLVQVGLFDVPGDTGTATSRVGTTLTTAGKAWTVNQWAGWYLYLLSGTGATDAIVISSNSADGLTVAAWNPGHTPEAGTAYLIGAADNVDSFMIASCNVEVVKGNLPMQVIWQITHGAGPQWTP